jgi:hypothetical protein
LAGYHRKFGSWGAAFEAYNGGPGAVGGGYAYSQKQVEAKLAEFGLSKAALGGGGRQTVSFFGEAKGLLDKAFGYALGGVLGGKGTGEAIHEANPGKVAESLNPLGALGSVADFFSMLTSGEFWIRAGEILAGAILLYMGLKNLTGVGASDLPGARPAARAAKVGAVAAVVK